MRKIYYIEDRGKKFWNNLWEFTGGDSDPVNVAAYPFYPTTQYIKTDGTILECGCGPGRLVNYFHNLGFFIIGMDFSFSGLKNLKALRPKLPLICADALQLPFSSGIFGYYCSFGVYGALEKKIQRKQFLEEAHRALKKDGVLILSVAAHNTLFYLLSILKLNNLLRIIFRKRPVRRYFCWYQFCKAELEKELGESGFIVKDIILTNAKQLFYDLFPFFRKRTAHIERRQVLRLERIGVDVHPLSRVGEKIFSFADKKLLPFFAVTLVAVAYKKNNV